MFCISNRKDAKVKVTSSLGYRAARGAVWATLDRFGSMGIQFVFDNL